MYYVSVNEFEIEAISNKSDKLRQADGKETQPVPISIGK